MARQKKQPEYIIPVGCIWLKLLITMARQKKQPETPKETPKPEVKPEATQK